MVKLMVPAAGLVTYISLAVAVQPQSKLRGSFSFQEWVDGIINDTQGDHLSPEEAWKTAVETLTSGG